MKPLTTSLFSIKTSEDFVDATLSVFHWQAANNEVYSAYVSGLAIDTGNVSELSQIPFLPIEFFKSHKILSGNRAFKSHIFTSSGTTGSIQSMHHVTDLSVYEESYLRAFKLFYGDIEEYTVFALLPSYLEREGSSLIYMASDLIKRSKNPESGFYLNDYAELIKKLKQSRDRKTLLIGVTYALLDLIEVEKLQLNNCIVMETGGMKGKRKEMVREELHALLCAGFGVKEIHSEYGMTELLSQAYSKGNGVFNCPPWMKIMIRDTNDPFTFLPESRTGGINVIDLANINSCSFIATQDLGKIHANGSFEVLGRFDNSDIRGCNLMVE
ncbi:MAG: acyl transferase [Bacteroidetes bacterium]|nr:acyl transferase [Bacteroidota bacterium]